MRTEDPITTFFRHHLWANLTLYEACRVLTDEQLDTGLEGTYGTIRDTLAHIARSEQSYHSRITTGQIFERPEDEPPMSLDDMIAVLTKTGEGLIEWAKQVSGEDSIELQWWTGEQHRVPKAIIMAQVLDHGTDHRSQIKTIMTQVGVQPPELQAWNYFDQLEE